jgi:hypothetical protein
MKWEIVSCKNSSIIIFFSMILIRDKYLRDLIYTYEYRKIIILIQMIILDGEV